MEMDELKTLWDKGIDLSKSNNDLSETKWADKSGPLAMLEKKNWIAFWLFPLAALLFAGTFVEHSLARHSLAMWLLLAILFAEFVFTIFNLITLKGMRNTQGSIRKNLLNRINMLGERFQLFLLIYVALYLVMAVLLEVTMHYRMDRLFDTWANVSWVIRVFTYVALLTVIFLAKRSSQNKHFGVYLQKLKTVAEQMN